MSIFNAEQNEAIVTFAKSNKMGKAKAEAFAALILSYVPQRTGGGRPTSENTLELRESIRKIAADKAQQKDNEPFTANQLAETLDDTPVNILSALRFLCDKEGVVKEAGKLNVAGKRGRKATLWQWVSVEATK